MVRKRKRWCRDGDGDGEGELDLDGWPASEGPSELGPRGDRTEGGRACIELHNCRGRLVWPGSFIQFTQPTGTVAGFSNTHAHASVVGRPVCSTHDIIWAWAGGARVPLRRPFFRSNSRPAAALVVRDWHSVQAI